MLQLKIYDERTKSEVHVDLQDLPEAITVQALTEELKARNIVDAESDLQVSFGKSKRLLSGGEPINKDLIQENGMVFQIVAKDVAVQSEKAVSGAKSFKITIKDESGQTKTYTYTKKVKILDLIARIKKDLPTGTLVCLCTDINRGRMSRLHPHHSILEDKTLFQKKLDSPAEADENDAGVLIEISDLKNELIEVIIENSEGLTVGLIKEKLRTKGILNDTVDLEVSYRCQQLKDESLVSVLELEKGRMSFKLVEIPEIVEKPQSCELRVMYGTKPIDLKFNKGFETIQIIDVLAAVRQRVPSLHACELKLKYNLKKDPDGFVIPKGTYNYIKNIQGSNLEGFELKLTATPPRVLQKNNSIGFFAPKPLALSAVLGVGAGLIGGFLLSSAMLGIGIGLAVLVIALALLWKTQAFASEPVSTERAETSPVSTERPEPSPIAAVR